MRKVWLGEAVEGVRVDENPRTVCQQEGVFPPEWRRSRRLQPRIPVQDASAEGLYYLKNEMDCPHNIGLGRMGNRAWSVPAYLGLREKRLVSCIIDD